MIRYFLDSDIEGGYWFLNDNNVVYFVNAEAVKKSVQFNANNIQSTAGIREITKKEIHKLIDGLRK